VFSVAEAMKESKNYQKQPSIQQTTGKNNFIVAYTTGFNRLCSHHQVHILRLKHIQCKTKKLKTMSYHLKI
jgi:hypothetical protein